MHTQELKDYIETNLIRKDGKLNSAILRREWFVQSSKHQEIITSTSFLPLDSNITERIFCIINDIQTQPICPQCNVNPKSFSPNFGIGYCKTCSNPRCKAQLSFLKGQQTKIERYGSLVSPNTIQKSRERATEIAVKAKKTIQENYNVENVSQINEIRNKIDKKRMDLKRGLINVLRQEKAQNLSTNVTVTKIEKRHKTRLVFNVEFKCNTCSLQDTMKYETYKWRCENLPTPCAKCSGVSCGNLKLNSFVSFLYENVSSDIVLNDTSVLENGNTLDVYIPDYKVAFEFQILENHGFNHTESTEERRKQLAKNKICESKGIQLINIFENEWDNKNEIVQSCIKSIFGKVTKIAARKCSIKQLNSEENRTFFNDNHLQGGNVSGRVSYGLVFENQIVAAMSFGVSRFDKTLEWELLRYANKIDTQVVGGASKLFKHFVKNQNPKNIISYADKRWSMTQKCMYNNLGFTSTGMSTPSYYYFRAQDGMKLHNRINFQKHKLKEKLSTFNENKTEAENMFDNGYKRIWDCGNNVFVWGDINTES